MTYAGYCRISLDRADEAGVTRQREDITALVLRLGGDPADIRWYVDNSVSAFKATVRRPEWERMLDDVRAGIVTTIVGYNNDRLLRQPKELEALIEVVEPRKVRTHSVTGMFDLSNDAGILTARMMVAVANAESRNSSRRVARAHAQHAEQGRRTGGPRAFGFEPDNATHRPAEVEAIRECYRRRLAGQSLNEIAAWLNETGVKPPKAEYWGHTSLRVMLTNPRVAGLRKLKGEIVAQGQWEPVVSREDYEAMMAIYGDPSRKRPGQNARQHLLAGFLTCECGAPMYSKKRKEQLYYTCRGDRAGCGRVTRAMGPIDEAVRAYVVAKTQARKVDARPDEASTQRLATIEREMEELEAFRAAGDLALGDYVRLLKDLRGEQQKLAQATVLAARPASAEIDDVQSAWDHFTLAQKRTLVGQFVETVLVSRPSHSGREFDLTTIQVVPRGAR